MKFDDQKKWIGYIANHYPERFLDEELGLILDENTILIPQSDASRTQFAIKLQKMLETDIPFSGKVEKKFLRRSAPILKAHNLEGVLIETDEGKSMIYCQMVIVGIYDQAQMDRLLSQLNDGSSYAKRALEAEFGL